MMERKTVQITTQREIPLGYQGENDAVQVVFVVEPLEENWMLLHQRSVDTDPYPVPLDVTDRGLVWNVSSGDTACNGIGRAQLICSGPDGEILKTCTYRTKVSPSLPLSGEVPDPVKPWYDALENDFSTAVETSINMANEAVNAANESANSSKESAASSSNSATSASNASKSASEAATSASEAATSASEAATSASEAAESAEKTAGYAQAMAGPFDFTGYLRYQVVEQSPETYEEGVLYIVAT